MAEQKLEEGPIKRIQTIPPLPTTERGCGIKIEGELKKSGRIMYCNDNIVVQRFLKEFNNCYLNSTSHAQKVRVARYNVNANYICSGDESGQIDVYGDVPDDQGIVKSKYDPDVTGYLKIGKKVNDIAWDPEPKITQSRALIVGAGQTKGKRLKAADGSSGYELMGPTKELLCCDYSIYDTEAKRFHAVVAGQDFTVRLYESTKFGADMKVVSQSKEHSNYVNGVKFNPACTLYVSVSSDKKICAFDARTGKLIKTIADGKGKNGHHTGSIYEISWSPDGQRFLTCSADKTCKIWNYETGEVEHTYTFADKPSKDDMQVGCIWLGNDTEQYLFSVSLTGRINKLSYPPKDKTSRPEKIFSGHSKNITDISFDSKRKTVYSCDTDSRVIKTKLSDFDPVDVVGNPHSSTQIKYVRVNGDNSAFYTVAVNDTVCRTEISDDEEKGGGCLLGTKAVKVEGAARGCCVGNANPNLFIVPTHKAKMFIFDGINISKTIETKGYVATTCTLSPDDTILAVGSGREGENSVFVYDKDYKLVATLKNKQYIRNEVVALSITADNKYLATADKDRAIWIWDLEELIKSGKSLEKPVNFNAGLKFHVGLISTIEFGGKDGKQLLTAANDSTIFIFKNPCDAKSDRLNYPRAVIGAAKKATWLDKDGDNYRIGVIGADSTLRFFTVKESEL